MINNMFPTISKDRLVARIQLLSQSPDFKVVLVEGSTDWSLFVNFIPEESILHYEFRDVDNNKQSILKVIDYFSQNKEISKRLIAIIDPDFDLIQTKKVKPYRRNVFFPRVHDMDLRIFLSKALEKYGNTKLSNKFRPNITKVINTCINIAIEYGYFRLIFHNNRIGKNHYMNFLTDIESYIDKDDYSFKKTYIISDAKSFVVKSKRISCEKIKNEKRKAVRMEQKIKIYIPNGHDVFRVLAKLILLDTERFLNLRETRGKSQPLLNLIKKYMNIELLNYYKKNFQKFVSELESDLKNSYDWDCFIGSKIYEGISNYEKKSGTKFLLK